MKEKKSCILGAGLAGMVAAVNLAKAGYEVTVLEAESGIGGSPVLHPSLHITPINKDKVWPYIGINLEECFVTLKRFPMFLGETRLDMYPNYFFGVERGPRPSSLDHRLYQEATRVGVGFKFGARVDRLDDLPPDTIIATGLDPRMYQVLGLPFRDIPSRHVFKPTERDQYGLGIFSEYASEYFYAAAINRLFYGMLPLNNPPDPRNLARLVSDLGRLEQIDVPEPEWRPVVFRVPLGGPANLRLFHGDKILAGTIAGMMDPFFLFGIHGALISGRVAALTVMDRGKGLAEFNRVNRHFMLTYRTKQLFERVPIQAKLVLLRSVARHPFLFSPLIPLMSRGIPGHEDSDFFYRSFVGPDYRPPFPFRLAGSFLRFLKDRVTP